MILKKHWWTFSLSNEQEAQNDGLLRQITTAIKKKKKKTKAAWGFARTLRRAEQRPEIKRTI